MTLWSSRLLRYTEVWLQFIKLPFNSTSTMKSKYFSYIIIILLAQGQRWQPAFVSYSGRLQRLLRSGVHLIIILITVRVWLCNLFLQYLCTSITKLFLLLLRIFTRQVTRQDSFFASSKGFFFLFWRGFYFVCVLFPKLNKQTNITPHTHCIKMPNQVV